MATAQDIIDGAMRDVGALASGESPSADETADVLEALNSMLDSWGIDGLMMFAENEISHTLTTNDGSYTIGPSGADITASRPQRIVSAFVRDGDYDYPVKVIDKKLYDSITDKTTQGDYPQYIYLDTSYANGTIKLWPYPGGAYTMKMTVQTVLSSLATAGTTFTMPPGYQRCVQKNLAIEIAPMFEKQPSAALVKAAQDSMKLVKRNNNKTKKVLAYSELGRIGHSRHGDITADI